jgi:chromosome segregation ATPase
VNAQELTVRVDALEDRLKEAIDTLKDLKNDLKDVVKTQEELRQQADRTLPVLQKAIQELERWKVEEDKEFAVYFNLKRDVDELKKWKTDQKTDATEQSRRWWSFGPNLTAAVISVLGTGVANLVINYLIKQTP